MVDRRAEQLEADGHARIAEGHRLLSKAAEARASMVDAEPAAWIPAAESPLGKRKTLALARSGAIASSKVGRSVLVRRASLAAFIEEHGRGGDADVDAEDIFGARRSA